MLRSQWIVETKGGSIEKSPTAALLYLRVSTPRQLRTDIGPEGLSIPAQRQACTEAAERVGILVTDEYIEPGRSGRSIRQRPVLRELLARVRRDDRITHLVVYELSRLARIRADDVSIVSELTAHGVTLVSATENVDNTPVGQLTHGLLATVNEYRSARDGVDIAYKMQQKVERGGTIGRAPIGYLNTLERTDGRDIRGVDLDPVRAPLIRKAFELFATDRYGYAELADILFARGLTRRTRLGGPPQSIGKNGTIRLLSNRYYLGYTIYAGTERSGQHPPLVTTALFDQVAAIIAQRKSTMQRHRRHHHYLKGLLYCVHCLQVGNSNSLLRYTQTPGRSGKHFAYYYCTQRTRPECRTYLPVPDAENQLASIWRKLRLTPSYGVLLQNALAPHDWELSSDRPGRTYIRADLWIRRIMNAVVFERIYPRTANA